VDTRNDGQLIFYDQFIPASALLAFINADHWAMSTPVAQQIPIARRTFANKNDYPQEVLLEAILRYVEEDLARTLNESQKSKPPISGNRVAIGLSSIPTESELPRH
jgi:hypothetical protein